MFGPYGRDHDEKQKRPDGASHFPFRPPILFNSSPPAGTRHGWSWMRSDRDVVFTLSTSRKINVAARRRAMAGLIKGLTAFATLRSFSRMRRTLSCAALLLLATAIVASAQEKRSWFNRLTHPFGSSEKIPTYKDPRIRGLALTVELPSEPLKLAEERQLPVHVILTNRSDRAVELQFPTTQRIEILLHNSSGEVVTRWSENRAFEERPATLLINPHEHVEYAETIATRELEPGKVFTVEVQVPAYPELRAQRKGIAAP
jgi:hypothetical protein